MACLELDDRILIIDVGLSFPSGDMPGIDLVLPDFDYLRSRADRIQAVVLTHGHEDHIGALPYLLRDIERRLEVYGTPFTLALLQSKLEEHEVTDLVDLKTVTPGEQATHGAVHDALPPGDALDPGRDGGRGRHAVRIDPPHGRLQDRPDPARREGHRSPRPGQGGRPRQGRASAPVGLHERRGAWLLRQRANGGAGAPRHRRGRRWVGRRGLLLQPHPPGPADRERRARERAGGGVPRAIDAQVRRGREALGPPPRRRQGRRGHLRGGPARSRPRRGDLHRLPGGAVLRPVAHGPAPEQVGRDRAHRDGGPVLVADPRERAGDPSGGRRAVSHRGRRVPHAVRPRPRLRSRRPGGAPADALARAAPLVHPGPRRAAPSPASRSRSPTRSGSHPSARSSARTATSWR